jgi:hypothetical protein
MKEYMIKKDKYAIHVTKEPNGQVTSECISNEWGDIVPYSFTNHGLNASKSKVLEDIAFMIKSTRKLLNKDNATRRFSRSGVFKPNGAEWQLLCNGLDDTLASLREGRVKKDFNTYTSKIIELKRKVKREISRAK